MKATQEDILNALSDLTNEDEIFAFTQAQADRLGFDFCAYGLRTALPLTSPKTVMFNNYSDEWRRNYREKNYLSIDPTVAHGLRSSEPIVWSDEVFAATPQLWEEARSHGLKAGWARSCRDARGACGMLTVARDGEPLSEAEQRSILLPLTWLVAAVHAAMSDVLVPKLMPEMNISLSRREVEILRWTAEGKTSQDIADIVNISERTVNHHVNNAMQKMGACNKTAAVIRAAMLGML